MELALKLLSDAELDALITGESRFEQLPTVLPAIAVSAGSTFVTASFIRHNGGL